MGHSFFKVALRKLQPCTRAFSTAPIAKREASGRPYSDLIVGCPRETYPGERRTAITPQNAALLLKKGFRQVLIASGSGTQASFPDEAYTAVGASIVQQEDVLARSDILLKVRPPQLALDASTELTHMKQDATLISFVFPAVNKELVRSMQDKRLTLFGMDCIPR